MDTSMTDSSGVSALHAIRDAELAMAGRLEEARRAADERIRSARAEVRRTLAAADTQGRAAADRMVTEALTQAEAAAVEIRAAGDSRARGLSAQVADRLDAVVSELVDFVLAPPLEEGK